jgi:starch synthase
MRVLYVSTEVHPALKTGGLADVNAALPPALIALGADVRLLLPAFPALLGAASGCEAVARIGPMLGADDVTLVRGSLRGAPVYLIDAPQYYARPGNPYVDSAGLDWPDNHLRFALLGSVAARFADGSFDGWRPDIVHAHDWHAGLAPAYVAARGGDRPGTVFTVHNLAYQGQFPGAAFLELGLPPHFFAIEGLEFYGGVNFMKAGLHYADRITTVSPTYAREIQTPVEGCGLDGLLRSRAGALAGILNGVDRGEWNPATDPRIVSHYDADALDGKRVCRSALREELGLSPAARGPLFGVVSRLTEQKGLDLLLGGFDALLAGEGQLALVGSGTSAIERGFVEAAEAHPGAVAVRIGYDESLAHRIVAGSDVIVVPSRFEPCGLTQMYGLAYGTLPLVRRAGGLADTVVDAARPGGTGFVFAEASVPAMAAAIGRVLAAWRDAPRWRALQGNAMQADFSWEASARRYAALYRDLRPAAA